MNKYKDWEFCRHGTTSVGSMSCCDCGKKISINHHFQYRQKIIDKHFDWAYQLKCRACAEKVEQNKLAWSKSDEAERKSKQLHRKIDTLSNGSELTADALWHLYNEKILSRDLIMGLHND